MIKATHSGTIKLGETVSAGCYVLEDGTRVLVASQIQGILGSSRNGMLTRSLARLSHGSEDLSLHPVPFDVGNGSRALGYTAEDVIKVLRAYQRAFLKDTLHDRQRPAAMAAMAAIESFADVGLCALIDDVTGYTKQRPDGELASYLNRIFAERMRAWSVCFDAEWDQLACKLYRHNYEGRPPRFAAGLNSMVYRIAFGSEAHSEMLARNPDPHKGSNHHQYLTDEARAVLSGVIATIKGLMRVSRNPADFHRKIAVVFKDAPLQLELS